MMTKQYAIDKAKLLSREKEQSYFVVQFPGTTEYDVLDEDELKKLFDQQALRNEHVIFSMIV